MERKTHDHDGVIGGGHLHSLLHEDSVDDPNDSKPENELVRHERYHPSFVEVLGQKTADTRPICERKLKRREHSSRVSAKILKQPFLLLKRQAAVLVNIR